MRALVFARGAAARNCISGNVLASTHYGGFARHLNLILVNNQLHLYANNASNRIGGVSRHFSTAVNGEFEKFHVNERELYSKCADFDTKPKTQSKDGKDLYSDLYSSTELQELAGFYGVFSYDPVLKLKLNSLGFKVDLNLIGHAERLKLYKHAVLSNKDKLDLIVGKTTQSADKLKPFIDAKLKAYEADFLAAKKKHDTAFARRKLEVATSGKGILHSLTHSSESDNIQRTTLTANDAHADEHVTNTIQELNTSASSIEYFSVYHNNAGGDALRKNHPNDFQEVHIDMPKPLHYYDIFTRGNHLTLAITVKPNNVFCGLFQSLRESEDAGEKAVENRFSAENIEKFNSVDSSEPIIEKFKREAPLVDDVKVVQKVVHQASAGKLGIKVTKSTIRHVLRNILLEFFRGLRTKAINPNYDFVVVKLVVPKALRQVALEVVQNRFLKGSLNSGDNKRVVLQIKDMKVFNGCRPMKKIKKKRKAFRPQKIV